MGEEPYFIDMISDYIENNVLDDSEKEFNQTILYGRDVSAADIIGAAKRFPMMSEHQVLIIKEAQLNNYTAPNLFDYLIARKKSLNLNQIR